MMLWDSLYINSLMKQSVDYRVGDRNPVWTLLLWTFTTTARCISRHYLDQGYLWLQRWSSLKFYGLFIRVHTLSWNQRGMWGCCIQVSLSCLQEHKVKMYPHWGLPSTALKGQLIRIGNERQTLCSVQYCSSFGNSFLVFSCWNQYGLFCWNLLL